jgi:1-acyl-sn-glycerol-3-phosphate acyltransferase
MAFLWSVLVIAPLIVFSTIVFGSVSVVASLFDSTGRAAMRVARVWSRSLLLFARVRVKVEGIEKIDPGASYIFCSNHLSYMDTPAVLSSIPAEFRFLAKEGLFQIPLLGTHLKQAGHIPVPREDPRRAIRTMTRAGRIVRERGVSLLIFAEGGRSRDGALRPFKEGAAYIAIQAQAPLVPVAVIGTREILPMGSAVFHAGRVRLRIGNPIPTEGLTLRDRKALTAAAHEQIADMLETGAGVNPRK